MNKIGKQIKVSVIIPVFNMGPWIGNAINAINKQTLKELEIICIDDGSTDNTLDVLNSYQQNYFSIKVIHQDNQGPGPARNRGIKEANGEYLAFLDADDYYYSDNALETLYNKAKENHAMICRGSSCDDREGIISTQGLRRERVFIEEGYISKEEFPGVVGFWSGIYNKQFLIDNNIFFPDIVRSEDGVFSATIIAKAGKIYCIPQIVYVYRKEHKTIRYTEKKAVDQLEGDYITLKIAKENGLIEIYNTLKREICGEKEALLYRYASSGNKKMLNLASEINTLINGNLYEGEAIKKYVNQIKKEKEQMLTYLKALDSVYIYGAGTVGRRVLAFLTDNGISIKSIIVTNPKQNPKFLEGIPIKTVSDIQKSEKYEVIIATFWYLQEEIQHTLEKSGINHYIPLDLCKFHLWQREIIH